MGVVSITIDQIDGKSTANGQVTVGPAGPNGWLVQGTATVESGLALSSLTWRKDLFMPPVDITRSANWSFYLPADSFTNPFQVSAFDFWVEALDNDNPQGYGGPVFAGAALPRPAPAPHV